MTANELKAHTECPYCKSDICDEITAAVAEERKWVLEQIDMFVVAERERCAKVAEGAFLVWDHPEMKRLVASIAAAIRKGVKP